jgi:hypothetical protein
VRPWSENAALFGDDIAFERLLVTFDPGHEAVAGPLRSHLWSFGPDGKVIAVRRMLDAATNIAAAGS